MSRGSFSYHSFLKDPGKLRGVEKTTQKLSLFRPSFFLPLKILSALADWYPLVTKLSRELGSNERAERHDLFSQGKFPLFLRRHGKRLE